MANKLKRALPDALLLTGAASVSVGAGMVYLPAGFIVAGAFAMVTGLRLAKVAG